MHRQPSAINTMWTHGALRVPEGESTRSGWMLRALGFAAMTLLVAAGCAATDFTDTDASVEEPDSSQMDEGEREYPERPGGEVGRDPDDISDEEIESLPDADVVEPPDSDIVEPGSSLCPWPENECLEQCMVSERSYDPCEGATIVSGGVLSSDTTWNGRYCVDGAVGVMQGVSLTIEPGSEIFFAPYVRLEVEGHLHAVGSDEAPILFSSTTISPYSTWGGIHIQLTEGGSLELRDATVEYAEFGVATWEHAFDPTFAGAETNVDIRETLFQFNWIGVVPDDNTVLTHSTIVCNLTGILVASEDDPVQDLRGNNLCHNHLVDVRAQQDGADVSDSWWCTTDLTLIQARTEDDLDSIDMGGLLVLEPFRDSPVPEAPPIP